MKNFIKFSILFLILSIIGISCNKDNLIENNSNPLSKEEISKIFKTYSDEKINALNIDIDKLIELKFTFAEREELILDRVKNLSMNGSDKKIAIFFEEFSQKYKKSYLESSFLEREEFSTYFLQKLKDEDEVNGKRIGCLWDALICTSMTDCNVEGDFINHSQSGLAKSKRDITNYDCTRQENTTDCDNTYSWIPSIKAYNAPNKYNFYWFCSNAVYRALYIDNNISGYRSANDVRFAAFLGNQHDIAVTLTWWMDNCPNDRFINVTHFEQVLKPTTDCSNCSDF